MVIRDLPPRSAWSWASAGMADTGLASAKSIDDFYIHIRNTALGDNSLLNFAGCLSLTQQAETNEAARFATCKKPGQYSLAQ
jgi:hypothetical protein